VCAMTTLTEDLSILAVGLKPKAGPNTGVLPLQFRFGLRGAELVTLTMAGRVAVRNGRIEVRDPAPLADPALNHALSQLVASGGAELRPWMTDLPPMYVTYHFERLRAAGAISPVQVRLLLIAKRTGYLVVDQAYFHDVRTRLHTAVTSPGPVDAAQAALAGLVYAAGLASLAYPGGEGAAARNRLEQLAGGNLALAGSAAAGARAGGAPVNDDPNRWAQFSNPAGGIGGAAIEAAVRSATEAAVHAVVSSVTAAVHSASDVSTHIHHHGGGSGSADSPPSHHH
jgi:Golgi phosphoprotein 3 (GPP34)